MIDTNQSNKVASGMEVPMVDPEIVRSIRRLASFGWGAKRIAAELGVARNTARRYMRAAAAGNKDLLVQARPGGRRLGVEEVAEALRLFADEAQGNAAVVQRLLAEKAAVASLRTVQRAVAPKRRELRRAQVATVRFETAPGKQLQIDFGEKLVKIGDCRVRVHFFVAVLGYCRRLFVKAFLSERQDDWHEGIVCAMRYFGGSPETLLIDNPKAMVLEHNRATRQVTLHPSFAAFCKEWDLTAKACAPYRARTKGKTESGVKYVKHNALAGLSFTSFTALEAHLVGWMRVADARMHGTTRQAPSVLFERDEKAALRPLPARPAPSRQRRLRRKVANDALVNVDTIRYSVPHRFVREMVEVQVLEAQVRIFHGVELISEHRRGHEPHSKVVVAAHYEGLWQTPRASDGGEAAAKPPDDLARTISRSLADYAAVAHGGSHE